MTRVLLIDHEDSFTFNLVQALRVLGARVEVRRDTALTADAPLPDAVLLGPGPGGPAARTRSLALLDRVASAEPGRAPRVLGVCLGLQLVVHWRGGRVARAHRPVHGFAERMTHDGRGLFAGLASPVTMARYHSLVALEPVPDDLEVSARSEEGEIMGLRSRTLPIECVQFHPESILSADGQALLSNFVSPRGPSASSGAPPPSGSLHSGHGPLEGRRGSGSESAGNSRTTPL